MKPAHRILAIALCAVTLTACAQQSPVASAPRKNFYLSEKPKEDVTVAVPKEPTSMMVCAADVQQCPDGRWIGRSGSKCEFACSTTPSAKQK